jgi:predicted adenylyl cyclase CyaB
MPKNIEIKAIVRDVKRFIARAEAVSDGPVQELQQVDTFFQIPHGRLKLRVEGQGPGQLIYYHRPDEAGPKPSHYEIFFTSDPDALALVLKASLGVRGVVRKVRRLYHVGQTRIHLDQVNGLGDYMELEVVLAPGQAEFEGQAIADDLRVRLGIGPEALVRGAYLDLLEAGVHF